jgi:polyphosphate kinase
VEVTVPVVDPSLCERLDRILATSLEDDVLAWELGADGAWTKEETVRGVNLHERLMQEARERVETG